ncbi:MAG: cystathionine beta-synthase [Chlamydia sp. 32-24]|nr:MAG: cystathionine beta-synthase [Chlamydia sp. 32-24]
MPFLSILDTIGKTPLVHLKKICPNPDVTLLAKIEYFNPGGSIKDRIVLHIINHAEQKGLLKPGGTIIENTSGNTGAAVAMIAAVRGYKAILVMPDKVSKEKQNTLKAFGAEIIVTPTAVPHDSPEHYENVAKRLAQDIPNSFRINQYDNLKNPEAHFQTTGPEIWEQTNGKIDYFVASGSTGGTISGIGKYLKSKNSKVKILMPDPIGSIYKEYFDTGKIPTEGNCNYYVEGIGEDRLTEAMDFSVVDQMIKVKDQDAFDTARLLAKKEGILAGGSAGANVWGALQLAETISKGVIVTIIPDSGVRYLSKMYNDEWMLEHEFATDGLTDSVYV